MRSVWIIVMMAAACLMQGQEVVLRGRVIDSSTSKVISDAYVIMRGEKRADVSDREGRIDLLLTETQEGEVVLETSHLSYERSTLRLDSRRLRREAVDGVYRFDISLTQGVTTLGGVDILSDRPPELVYGSERHSVADYERSGDRLLLLTYEKNLRRSSTIYLADMEMRLLDSLSVPSGATAQGFEKDYQDRVFLLTDGQVLLVSIVDDRLRTKAMGRQEYRDRIAPVVDTVGGQLLFSTWTERFPAFDFYGFKAEDSSYHHLRQIADEFMLELCRAEYKYLNTRDKLKLFRLELETGIEREVLACVASFENGQYYDPIHAPMFVWRDTIRIFDHHNDLIYSHRADRSPIDSVAIDYHSPGKVMNNHFTDRLVMDEDNGQVFAIYQYPGGSCTLASISMTTGEVIRTHELDFDYPEGIRVYKGEAYYIYRPFESLQKKYLYKEVLE